MIDNESSKTYNILLPATLTLAIPLCIRLGVIETIIINLVEEGCHTNKVNKQDYFFRQNNWWTRFSTEKAIEKYPFLGSARTLRRILKRLREEGYLISENFNESKLDKALWYRVNKKLLSEAFVTEES